MLFKNFNITATPHIAEASCKCGNNLIQVPNGMFGAAMFCPKCESVYELKLVKVPDSRVGEDFLEQCRKKMDNKR